VAEEQSARVQIERLLRESGIVGNNIERIAPSLEDVFIYLLEQESRKAA